MSGATTKSYWLHKVLLGTTIIPVAEDLTSEMNFQILTMFAAAASCPSGIFIPQGSPEVRFTTTAIKEILDLCTSGDGVSIDDQSGGNCDLVFRPGTNFGSRSAIDTGDAQVIRCDTAALVWESIQAQEGAQPATITCRIVPTYDGTNPPVIGVGSQTVAEHSNVPATFSVGPVKVNGSFLDGVTGWRLDQGLQLHKAFGSGLAWPTYACLARVSPVLTVDFPDLSQFDTYDLGVQATALIAFLRKLNADVVGHVVDATEEHISLAATDNPAGSIIMPSLGGGLANPASAQLQVNLRRSDVGSPTTIHPLTVDTTAAIA